jgi:hypothetical protein
MTPQEVAVLLPEVKWVESALTKSHSPVELGAEDTVILSGVAKPSCQYPKVAGHPKPPIEPVVHPPVVPCHGKATNRTTFPKPLASKKKPPNSNATDH